MEKVKISIIVPVYNVEQYLEECLNSLINQTLIGIEIIIVNDGSTDNSTFIINKYKNKYKNIKVINQKNSGLSEARNTGIKNSTGKYLAFVDSDDYVDVDMFEKLYNKAEKFQCNMIICDMMLYWNKIKMKPYNNLKQDQKNIYELEDLYKILLDKELNCQVMNKIYRRDIWIKNNITFEKGRYYEDIYPSFKLINIFKRAMFINSPMYKYRMRQGSITASSSQKKILDYIYAFSKARKCAQHFFSVEKNVYKYFMSFDVNYGLYGLHLAKFMKNNAEMINLIKERINLNYNIISVICNKRINVKSKIKFLFFKFGKII